MWSLGPYQDQQLRKVHYRLQEVASILATIHQTQRILAEGNTDDSDNVLNSILMGFQSLGGTVWQINAYSEEAWRVICSLSKRS